MNVGTNFITYYALDGPGYVRVKHPDNMVQADMQSTGFGSKLAHDYVEFVGGRGLVGVTRWGTQMINNNP